MRNKSKESAIKVSGDWIDHYETHSNASINYRLMKPLVLNEKKSYPVIVSLHGAGGRGTDNRKQLRDWNKLLTDKKIRSEGLPSFIRLLPLEFQAAANALIADLKATKKIEQIKQREKKPHGESSEQSRSAVSQKGFGSEDERFKHACVCAKVGEALSSHATFKKALSPCSSDS